ncbi:unnamed protein product [Phytophthora fragariaefolia]|uniref:Unnamed protein product n=1 Tax=Phytophthora fragariaefolia TaxID=1490495 RepID=A0A9W6XVB2_9STRA|nr:unnamed protein product [Phytophthora fragariaefolia]
MVQGRAQADDDQVSIEGGQAMAATEDVPKTVWTTRRRTHLSPTSTQFVPCGADGMEIEQCDVDTALRYGKLEEEIYMELPEGLRELLELPEAKGEDDVVCMLLQSLYGLKQASRVWKETIDKHLKSMGFKPVDAGPCGYTRGEGEEECIVCLYVDDMLIASRQKTMIASVKAGIAETSRIKDLGKARFILSIAIDYDMERRTVGTSPGMMLMMCGAPVLWRSRFQKTVALSSTEADYMALSDGVKECIWMRCLLKDVDVDQVGATVIYEDNQGAMALAKNVGYQACTKHIDIRNHFIREKVASNEFEMVYVESKNQLADYLTKGPMTKPLRYPMMASNVGPKLETSNCVGVM